jgi:hypothetical protein
MRMWMRVISKENHLCLEFKWKWDLWLQIVNHQVGWLKDPWLQVGRKYRIKRMILLVELIIYRMNGREIVSWNLKLISKGGNLNLIDFINGVA